MDRSIEFTYPKGFAKVVAWDYVRQQFWSTTIGIVLLVCLMAAFIPHSPGWEAPLLTLSVAAGLIAMTLRSHYTSVVKRWNNTLERMLTRDARLRLTDETIAIASSNGTHEYPWRTIRLVIRASKLCYFTCSDCDAFCVPACTVDDEAWDFIEARVKAAGGTCQTARKRE